MRRLFPVLLGAALGSAACGQRPPAGLIDFDAGRIATGEMTIEETGWELFRMILDVASGRTKVWSDHWGIHNDLTLFNPAPVT